MPARAFGAGIDMDDSGHGRSRRRIALTQRISRMVSHALRDRFAPFILGSLFLLTACCTVWAEQSPSKNGSLIYELHDRHSRQEMTVNTSRIITLSKTLTEANKIPQAQVNNPEIIELTALSPEQVQVFAASAGVTQINLWDENDEVYTIDVIVYADAQELTMLLESEFPDAALKVKPVNDGVLISGYVDQPERISTIIEIAESYFPKVLTNMRVGGVHQVLLHVKAMEVSRTKLRALGFDWAKLTHQNLVASGVSGLLGTIQKGSISIDPGPPPIQTTTFPMSAANSGSTFRFDIIDGTSAFFGVMEALRQDSLAKVLAEPTLVTVSGRPAFFQVGGEVPTLVPQGLGTTAVEYRRYGTQIDFVPIVLGNGRIRLEVRPRLSDIDAGRSINLDGRVIYAFTVKEVDTGVELQAGQTLAIAGLIQTRTESQRRGLPWVSEVPYIGALFRRVEERSNEIESLILVTPELVDAMDAHEVPQCGPGMQTTSPNDWELFMREYIEVPNCCPTGDPGMISEVSGEEPGLGQVIMQQDIPAPKPDPVGRPVPRTRDAGRSLAPEPIQTPEPSASAPEPPKPVPNVPSLPDVSAETQEQVSPPSDQQDPSNPQTPESPGPSAATLELPGFMGPIGYDVRR